MKNNKAPGPDGIPTEFFKAFFKNDVLSDDNSNSNALFADDIVLIAPGKKSLRKSLNKVNEWAIKNEMTFGINKCATLVVKPLHFKNQDDYVDPTFHLGFNSIPKTTQYTYLGIPFNESLSLQPIISNLNSKLKFYFKFIFPFSNQ